MLKKFHAISIAMLVLAGGVLGAGVGYAQQIVDEIICRVDASAVFDTIASHSQLGPGGARSRAYTPRRCDDRAAPVAGDPCSACRTAPVAQWIEQPPSKR